MSARVRRHRTRDGRVEEDGSRAYNVDGTAEKAAHEHAALAGVGDWMNRNGPWRHYWDGSWHVSEGLDPNGRYVVCRTRFESADGTPFVPQTDLLDLLEGDPE